MNVRSSLIKTLFHFSTALFTASLSVFFATCADYESFDDTENDPLPVTLRIIAATDSTVTLRWSRYREDDFSYYAVYYGTDDIVDNNDKRADSMTFSIDTVKTVRQLNDLTHYYFRVLVVNKYGRFSASAIVDTTTPENLKGILKLASPQRNSDNEILLTWTNAVEKCDRYIVYADSQRTVDTADMVLATIYGDTTKTLAPLENSSSWWLRVYAMLDSSVVAKSQVVELPPVVRK